MKETRTISHLLHPPLIDELGFSSAAKWYVEGFSERSGIKVNLEMASDSQRLHRSVELPLFRVLQASLSNVHRHAESRSVDICFKIDSAEAKLEVRDYGKGINRELLGRFNRTGAGFGSASEVCANECVRSVGASKSTLMVKGRSFAPLFPYWHPAARRHLIKHKVN